MTAEGDRIISEAVGPDEVLNGGLMDGQRAVVSGPGTGKTMLSLQFSAASEGPTLSIGVRGVAAAIDGDGIQLGEKLTGMRGVLTGVPERRPET